MSSVAALDAPTGPTIIVPSGRKRRAAVWAINEGYSSDPSRDAPLRGCLTDRDRWVAFLEARGYEVRHLANSDATKANILELRAWLLLDTKPEDTAGEVASSHGARDKEGHARLCTAGCLDTDFNAATISGVETREHFGAFHTDATTWAAYDACHAGGVRGIENRGRPKFLPHPDRAVVERSASLAALIYHGLVGAFQSFARVHRDGVILEEPTVDVLMAACRIDQTAADAYIQGVNCGAFSTYVLEAYAQTPVPGTAVDGARGMLERNGYTQRPEAAGRDVRSPLF